MGEPFGGFTSATPVTARLAKSGKLCLRRLKSGRNVRTSPAQARQYKLEERLYREQQVVKLEQGLQLARALESITVRRIEKGEARQLTPRSQELLTRLCRHCTDHFTAPTICPHYTGLDAVRACLAVLRKAEKNIQR